MRPLSPATPAMHIRHMSPLARMGPMCRLSYTGHSGHVCKMNLMSNASYVGHMCSTGSMAPPQDAKIEPNPRNRQYCPKMPPSPWWPG